MALLLGALAKVSATRADAPDDQFAGAAELYNQQRWDDACQAFGKWIGTNADHRRASAARFYYGEALAQLGRSREASEQFSEMLKRDPQGNHARQALFRRAEIAYLARDEEAAKRDLEQFRDKYPDDALNAYVLVDLGQIELHAGHVAEAQKLLERALDKYPDGPLAEECQLALARIWEQQGEHDKAQAVYQKVINAQGSAADQATLQAASLNNSRSKFADAVATLADFEKKFSESTWLTQARLTRAYAMYKLDRFDEAEQAAAEALAAEPSNVDAHYWKGLAQKGREQWLPAAETLASGAKLDESHRLHPALAYHAGDAFLRADQPAKARSLLEQVLAANEPSDFADDCQFALVQLEQRAQSHEACIRAADELARRFPASRWRPNAELAKGQAFFALQRYSDAAAQATAAKSLIPGDASAELRRDVFSLIALAQSRQGNYTDAQVALAELKAAGGDDAWQEATCQVAELALADSNIPVARELFTSVAGAKTNDDILRRSQLGLGWCQYHDHQWADAARTFAALIQLFPTHADAGEAAYLRARALEQVPDADGAVEAYCWLAEKHSANAHAADALWRAARLRDDAEQTEAALELYGRLIAAYPSFEQLDAALYRQAWLLAQTDRSAEAVTVFERLRHDFPQSRLAPDATLRLAEYAFDQKQYDDAMFMLAEIIKPTAPAAVRQHALYLQARVAGAAGHWAQAQMPLDQLLADFPVGPLVLPAEYLRAEVSFQLNQFEDAQTRFAALSAQAEVAAQPWAAMVQLRHAQSLAQRKQWPESLEAAQAIATRFPNFSQQHEADLIVGRAQMAAADFVAARESLMRVVDSPRAGRSATAAMAQWLMGETYFHQEDFARALTEYGKVEAYPHQRWQAMALLESGKCHERLGAWDRAAATYDRIAAEFPTGGFADEAVRRAAAARSQLAAKAKLK